MRASCLRSKPYWSTSPGTSIDPVIDCAGLTSPDSRTRGSIVSNRTGGGEGGITGAGTDRAEARLRLPAGLNARISADTKGDTAKLLVRSGRSFLTVDLRMAILPIQSRTGDDVCRETMWLLVLGYCVTLPRFFKTLKCEESSLVPIGRARHRPRNQETSLCISRLREYRASNSAIRDKPQKSRSQHRSNGLCS